MGRAPCCDKANVKKGPWSPEEDAKLKEFIHKYGSAGNWIALPQKAGLKRCGKSCRLRWLNYLRPNIKHGEFTDEEDIIICTLYATIGSRWSIIASQLPGRTDNDIKNYWNTKLKKKILGINNIPSNQTKLQPFSFPLHTQTPQPESLSNFSHLYTTFHDQAQKPLGAAAANLGQQNCLYSNAHNEGLGDFNSYYPIKDNMLVFGANEGAASCSSSDGSYGGGKGFVKKEDQDGFFTGFMENPNAFSIDDQEMRGGFVGDSQLEFDLEEVKQLIASAAAGGGGGESLFSGDGNYGGAMGMYYL